MPAGLIAFLNVFSSRKLLQPHATQSVGVHIYQDKKSIGCEPYNDLKKKYIEARGLSWYSNKRRSDRLKDSLNELEELLLVQNVVAFIWKSIRTCQVVLSNGIIVHLTISAEVPDIERLEIDKSFMTKINSYICSGICHDNFMVFALLEKSELLLVNLNRKMSEKYDGVPFENKVSIVNLPGPSGRRLKRNMAVNTSYDKLCVWWTSSKEESWSWSPIHKNYPNIVVLSLVGISSVYSMEISNYITTAGDLIDVQFCCRVKNQILTVEQKQSTKVKCTANINVYDATDSKVIKVGAVSLSLKGYINCVSRNAAQTKIVIMSSCGRLILWDEERRQQKTIKPLFVCTAINWHPSDCLFVITSSKGDIQIFDQALNKLSLQLVGEEVFEDILMLSKFFFTVPKLSNLSWATDIGTLSANDTVCCCDDMLFLYERGPLCVLRFELGVCSSGMLTVIELTCEYLKHQQFSEAVNLLSSMNWDVTGEECFQCLCLIAECSFAETFDEKVESIIEETLGSFYAPQLPLSEKTILTFKDDVSRIARKFFQLLLRFKRYEKAFLLAIDIGSKDLFMDIHYCALEEGKIDLANVSKNRAFLLHNQSSTEVLETGKNMASYENDIVRRLESTCITHTKMGNFQSSGNPLLLSSPPKCSTPLNSNKSERKYSKFKNRCIASINNMHAHLGSENASPGFYSENDFGDV